MGDLTFQSDPVEDILTIQTCLSPAKQSTEKSEDEVLLARLNPESGNVEALEILFFSKWVEQQTLELPIVALLQPAT